MNLEELVQDLVASAPLEETAEVQNLLSILLPSEGKQLVRSATNQYLDDRGLAIDGYILLKLVKEEQSGKYIDFIGRKKFNVDRLLRSAVDIESFNAAVQYPPYFQDLVSKLKKHGELYYPSKFDFTIIPQDEVVDIITVGHKLDRENFFSGTWLSKFTVSKSGAILGETRIDVHYFEEGNVRLSQFKSNEDRLKSIDASSILEYIEKEEGELILSMMDEFTQMNQNQFKRLRRLLPVTKAKVNWGKAIGTYKLGSNILEK